MSKQRVKGLAYRVFYVCGVRDESDGWLSHDLPKTYATRAAAQAAINKHVATAKGAKGLIYKRAEYKVVPA